MKRAYSYILALVDVLLAELVKFNKQHWEEK